MNRFLQSLLATAAVATPLHAGTKVFQTFDGDGFDDWKVEGAAFGVAPVAGKTPAMKSEFKGYSGEYLTASAHGGDAAVGTLTSPEFAIPEPYIAFLIAGGNQAGKTAAQLLVDGKVVREATGKNDLDMRATVWDVREFLKKKAQIRLIDEATGAWGIIGVDHFIFTDYPNQKFPNTTRGGKSYAAGLINDPNLPGVTIPENTTLKVAATEKGQQVISPTALTFDEQGAIFISETHRFRFGVEDNRERLYWYIDDLKSQEPGDRRKMYDKYKDKVSIESLTAKSELVRKLVDKDGDGVYETSTVFADGFNDVLDGTAAGVYAFEGTTYFACIPKIWMLRDENGDGISDQKKVVEEGFGIRVSISGHDLNGFTTGPDGRIYGTCGDRGLSFTTKEGKKYHYPNEGTAFRFEPDGTGFEIFHTGLRNPKEIAFDALGNPFTVDNNSDQGDAARIVYLVEGGDSGWQMENQTMHTFHRQIGLANRPPSRWMNEKMWELRNDAQPAYLLPPVAHLTAGPSGLAYYPGTGFLESEKNHFVICDYRGSGANSGVWSFEMKPSGGGMEMIDNRKLAWGIGATDVEYSFDGKLFISDFVNGWTSSDKGRIISLDAGAGTFRAAEAAETSKLMKEGFSKLGSEQLAKLLTHPDLRIRLRAEIALTRKPDGLKFLGEATKSTNPTERIHGLWGLGVLARRGDGTPTPANGGFSSLPDKQKRELAAQFIIPFLQHEDEETRVQALRAIATSPVAGDGLPLGILIMDKSPRVAFEAAITAGRMGAVGQFSTICKFIEANNNKDVFLRHAGIFALEKIALKGAQLEALKSHNSPAVRLAAVVALRRTHSPKVALFAPDADPAVSDEAVRAIYDNELEAARPVAAALLDNLTARKWAPFMLRRLIHNSFRIGDATNLKRVLSVATSKDMPDEVREEALRLVSIWTEPLTNDQLTGHYRPLPGRNVEDIKPTLNEALPGLLKQDGIVLTAALGYMEHYKLDTKSLAETTLRGIITNGKLPAEARAEALVLLTDRKPSDLNAFLGKIATDPANEVALSALKGLAKSDPQAALAPLQAAVESKNNERAQKAWTLLAGITGKEADVLFVKHLDALKASAGVSPSAIELIEGAKTRKDPAVAAALAALEKSFAESTDPLTKWNIALEGGDAKAGFSLYSTHPAAQCMRCHRADDGHSNGGDAGPNLVGIGKRHDRHYFLESMVLPSAKIAPGFGAVMVTFKDKTTLGGNLVEDGADFVDINVSGKVYRVKKADIAEFPPAISAMPPMEYMLKPAEMRDLVAWLESLQKEAKDKKTAVKPIAYDPKNPPKAN